MKNINLVLLTDETNIKGKTAFVKVELLGKLTETNNICAIGTIKSFRGFTCNKTPVKYFFDPSTVFIPKKINHDSNRIFEKGDWVKPKEGVRGLNKFTEATHYVAISSEDSSRDIQLRNDAGELTWLHSYLFELVKPVEEIEEEEREKNPYTVSPAREGYIVRDRMGTHSYFSRIEFGDDLAKEITQFVCDKLNEQHRKENNL